METDFQLYEEHTPYQGRVGRLRGRGILPFTAIWQVPTMNNHAAMRYNCRKESVLPSVHAAHTAHAHT